MRKPPVDYAINFDADEPACLENAYQILPAGKKEVGQLATDFGVPPFDVFQVAAGSWAARREKWIREVGIWGRRRPGQ